MISSLLVPAYMRKPCSTPCQSNMWVSEKLLKAHPYRQYMQLWRICKPLGWGKPWNQWCSCHILSFEFGTHLAEESELRPQSLQSSRRPQWQDKVEDIWLLHTYHYKACNRHSRRTLTYHRKAHACEASMMHKGHCNEKKKKQDISICMLNISDPKRYTNHTMSNS